MVLLNVPLYKIEICEHCYVGKSGQTRVTSRLGCWPVLYSTMF